MTDICIIGGGASGMTAAICAKESNPALDIIIFEKKNQTGKKILASGNGKCNLSNQACPGVETTLEFFRHLGILTRTDAEGRLYPYTEEARAVRDALDTRLRSLGVKTETLAEVSAVEKNRDGTFTVELGNKSITAGKVLIACGGKAGSAFGTTGDGFRFARRFGHKVNKPVPVLTAVNLKEDLKQLSGIRVKGKVTLTYLEKPIFSETGEIQFTESGISGICIFNLSRYLMIPEGKTFENGFDDYKILIDFFPETEDIKPILEERKVWGFEKGELLRFLVRRPLAELMEQKAGCNTEKMAQFLKAFPLSPSGVRGWDYAQATRGGVCLSEVSDTTMESKLVPGLYFAGEVLDYDGPCGGFNLQHAWETGIKAGKEMAR